MRIQNGFHVFSKGDELPALSEGLTDETPRHLKGSHYGFKISTLGSAPQWVAASRDDFVQAEARRLRIATSEVHAGTCPQPAPRRCCPGPCEISGHLCCLVYEPADHYYYCTCVW